MLYDIGTRKMRFVAAPQYGVITCIGLRTRQSYSKDMYHSDVANALVNFDSGSGAGTGSETFWTPPEPVVIRDYAIVTGMTDTTKLQITRNGIPTGDILRFGPHTDSVATRPRLNILVPPGMKLGAIQLA